MILTVIFGLLLASAPLNLTIALASAQGATSILQVGN